MRRYDMSTQEKFKLIQKNLNQKHAFFAGILDKCQETLDSTWKEELVQDLERMFGPVEGDKFAKALEGYVEFSIDAARNQQYFLKHGRYRSSSFSDVKQSFYDNEEHMLGNYLPGMFVSHYIWPHHYSMGRRYRSEVMPKVRERNPQLFIEVGTGSAMYTKLTMEELPKARGIGYDISPHSVAFGKRVTETFEFANRFTFVQQDAFKNPPSEKPDYIVSQEVLEHLEDPQTFCTNLCKILRDDGCAYITAAVTAAHSDHIYLFNSPLDLRRMLEKAGFRSLVEIEEASFDTRVPEKTPRIAGHLVIKA